MQNIPHHTFVLLYDSVFRSHELQIDKFINFSCQAL